MSYHNNPAINDTVLSIINDGEGTMCGMSYKERCLPDIVNHGIAHYRNAVRTYSKYRKNVFELRELTLKEQLDAADILQEYYRKHIIE